MPLRNLFKNCIYYWGFAAYVAYHVNHPQFTSPCMTQVYIALGGFLVSTYFFLVDIEHNGIIFNSLFDIQISELGNLSIHINLRNLRPPGTSVRKIPVADANPLTALFNFVSCPNYTYEFLAWLSFSILTQCLPSFLFALAGVYQMAVWALGKHRNYKKEFKDYPKGRKAIIPFIL